MLPPRGEARRAPENQGSILTTVSVPTGMNSRHTEYTIARDAIPDFGTDPGSHEARRRRKATTRGRISRMCSGAPAGPKAAWQRSHRPLTVGRSRPQLRQSPGRSPGMSFTGHLRHGGRARPQARRRDIRSRKSLRSGAWVPGCGTRDRPERQELRTDRRARSCGRLRVEEARLKLFQPVRDSPSGDRHVFGFALNADEAKSLQDSRAARRAGAGERVEDQPSGWRH